MISFFDELFQYALTANCITYVQAALNGRDGYTKPRNINSVAEVLELLKNRGVLNSLLRQKEVFDMTMATFSRDDILLYQGREEGELKLICKFFRNGGTEESAKRLLNVTDDQISAAKAMLSQNQLVKEDVTK